MVEIIAASIAAVAAIICAYISNKTHRQVTVNHHSSKNPTLRDFIDDRVGRVEAKLDDHIKWHLDHKD